MERKLLDMTNQLFISEYNPRMKYCDKFQFVGIKNIYSKIRYIIMVQLSRQKFNIFIMN